MSCLGIQYLMGWAAAAADGAEKKKAEWPPHPDRIFMAMAAAWFETNRDEKEREALLYLESLPSPAFKVSTKVAYRTLNVFVPVNDTSSPIAKKDGLATPMRDVPLYRVRHPRSFPVVIPQVPVVYLIWNEEFDPKFRPALESLCSKVTHIGHSSSFVHMWVEDRVLEPNLVPGIVGNYWLRVFGKGRLDYLISLRSDYTKRSKILRPEPGPWTLYKTADPPSPPSPPLFKSIFDPNILIFRVKKRLALSATLQITQAMRSAVLRLCPESIPEWISGHQSDGRPTRHPHMAVFPLPFVGSKHADGSILGIGIAFPREVFASSENTEYIRKVYEALLQKREIKILKNKLICEHEPDSLLYNLQTKTWVGPAKVWASVTPVVLDRHLKRKKIWNQTQIQEQIKTMCIRVGLPTPLDVVISPTPILRGVPLCSQFPLIVRKGDGGTACHTYVLLTFEHDIVGPVLIGSGRFKGYGLLRPFVR